MKPKAILLLVAAVGSGLTAAFLTYHPEPAPSEKVSVLIARKILTMGEVIQKPEECFQEKRLATEDIPEGALIAFDQLQGKKLKRALKPGHYIFAEDLLDEKETGLQRDLPEGHLAIGIRVQPQDIAAGFACLPLSRVNIIATFQKGSKSHGGVLLQDVLVLAIDTKNNPDQEIRPGNVVTVALKPRDAVKLKLAEKLGTLSLGLRAYGEKNTSEIAMVDEDELFGRKRIEPPLPPPPPPAPPVPYHIMTFQNGTAFHTKEFTKEQTGP